MEVIAVLSSFSLLVLWITTLIGLISPKILQSLRKSKEITRKDILIGSAVISIVLFIIIAVTAPAPVNNEQGKATVVNIGTSEKKEEKNTEAEAIDYEIISDEDFGNVTRKVNVLLPERISEQQLRQVANEIKNESNNSYERTLIMYRIKGEKSVAAWATTHFDPNLDVHFIGLSADDFKKLLSIKYAVDGEVIGQWISPNGFTDHIVVFYKKDKKYFKQDFYIDATLKPDELRKDGNTYRYKDPDETQYFTIDSNGNLEYHGESGNIYLANKIDK